MDLAWISLAALVVTIVLSCTTSVNPGVVAIVFAWLIGVVPGTGLRASRSGSRGWSPGSRRSCS